MSNTRQQYLRAGQRAIGAGIFALIAAAYLFMRGNAGKAEFHHLNGSVEFLKTELPGVPDRHAGKIRYLKLAGHDRIFYLFVGAETGDFSPAVNRVDELKTGDSIDLYYSDTYQTAGQTINKLTRYIEKDGTAYFERGNADSLIAGFVALAALGLCFWGIRLTRKYKNLPGAGTFG